ncbi:hypothetical protein AMTRI_Chr03g53570 [Amborella trichopoda]
MNKSRNFRRRGDVDNDRNGEDNDAPPLSKPLSPKTQKPTTKEKKGRNSQGSKLLSFAGDGEAPQKNQSERSGPKPPQRNLLSFDEEDGGSPNIQRSIRKKPGLSSSHGSSHKIIAGKDRTSIQSPSVPSNVQPQAGQYTKEKLLELQKNTKTLGGSKPPSETKPAEPVIVLKGLVKPILEERKSEKTQVRESMENDREKFSREKEEAESSLGKMGIGQPKEEVGSPVLDQATINAIKAKRERLRQARMAPDYISLDSGGARSMRDSDGLGSSDDESEFQGRIALLGEGNNSSRKGVFENADEKVFELKREERETEVDDDDEEDKKWEEEQFRKALGKRMDDNSNRGSVQSVASAGSVKAVQSSVYSGGSYHGASSGLVSNLGVGVTRSVEFMTTSQQAEVATQALRDSMARLKESHDRTISSIVRTDNNLSASLSNIIDLEKSLSAAGEKYLFMQKLRDFVSVICDFLQDKAPFIEELEEQMQRLHEERASAIVQRRADDDADEMAEIEAAVNAAISVFNKGGSVSSAASAAQAASLAAKEQSNLPVELDEFGRDVNLQKRMDSKRRAEARKRRKAWSESKRIRTVGDGSSYQRIEGESSTDESDSDSTAYRSSCDELLQTASEIFGDAADEFSNLSVVKVRFEGWKRQYLPTYRDAYMSMNASAIFSPYVRLELLKWDPLYKYTDFDDMRWHSLLFDYGIKAGASGYESDDSDADLIPKLVEKVALPILHHDIAHCWDMLSTKETKNAVSATKLLIDYIPASSEALQELLVSVRTRLSEAVSKLKVPTWSTLVINAVPQAAQIAAYRFGTSVRLMKNICLWKDIIALPVLEQLVLDELLCARVLPHVRNIMPNIHDAITRTERVVASLAGVWTGRDLIGDRSSKLQPLVDYLMSLGKTLEKKHALGVSTEETTGLARRLKCMLVELNEYDKGRAILRTFQLREAL